MRNFVLNSLRGCGDGLWRDVRTRFGFTIPKQIKGRNFEVVKMRGVVTQ